MQYVVVMSRSSYTRTAWQWRLCVDLRLLNVWNNGCRIGPKQTARTCYWWLMQKPEVVISPLYTLQRWWRRLHYNIDYGSALIFVGWTYGTGVVLALDEQRVRCIALSVLALGCVISDRCSMRSQFHSHVLFCCPMAMTALRWPLFSECMEQRVSCWP